MYRISTVQTPSHDDIALCSEAIRILMLAHSSTTDPQQRTHFQNVQSINTLTQRITFLVL